MFKFKYTQWRLSKDGTTAVPERKTHTYEAANKIVARSIRNAFLDEGALVLNGRTYPRTPVPGTFFEIRREVLTRTAA